MTSRIDEEKVCADSLADHLKTVCGCREVNVECNNDDPPDFWVTVDGTRLAVEVTSIVRDQCYHACCRELKEDVERSAKGKGVLKGTYILHITRNPRLPKRRSPEWTGLIAAATQYMSETIDCDSHGRKCLFRESNATLSISKVSGQGEIVGCIRVQSRWQQESRDELVQMMRDAVAKKRKTLERRKSPSRSVMLLLYDAFGQCDTDSAEKVLLTVAGHEWFHSVFWAASFTDRSNELFPENPGRKGRFIYSCNANWWRRPQS